MEGYKLLILSVLLTAAQCDHKPIYPLPIDMCPSEASMSPCKCTGYANVECSSSLTTGDLTRIFKLEWKWPEPYRVLVADDTAVTTLLPGMFPNVCFNYFRFVNNKHLEVVERDAFKGCEAAGQIMVLANNSIQSSSVFRAISSLENLEIIELQNNRLREIPPHAFGHLTKVTRINLENNEIRSIGAYAFDHLVSLTYLGLTNNKLTHLGDNSLAFRPGDISVVVQLSGNLLSSASENAFRAIDRSVSLILSQNNLTSLYKDSFEPLVYGMTHAISTAGNPIKCDCNLKWIAERPQYHHILKDAICTNGKDPADIFSDLLKYCYEDYSLDQLAYKK